MDLLPAYRGLRWDLLVVNGVDDEHPNEIAHRIAAGVLLRALDDVVPWTEAAPDARAAPSGHEHHPVRPRLAVALAVTAAPPCPRRRPAAIAAAMAAATALSSRHPPVLSDRVVADVLRYRKVADHVLDVSWNPYQAPRLYPYPPLWVWFEAAADGSRASRPVLRGAGEAARAGRGRASWSLLARWGASAARPPLVGVALRPASGGHADRRVPRAVRLPGPARAALRPARRSSAAARRSALALAAGIALKSFPMLLLPFALLASPARARACGSRPGPVPVALLLLPFAVADRGALSASCFGLRRRGRLRMDRRRARVRWVTRGHLGARPTRMGRS